MKRWALAVAVVLAANAAWAVNPMLNKGVRELGVSGSMDNDGDDFGMQLSGKFGYFIMDCVELGGAASAAFRGDEQRMLGGGAFGQYNFDTGTQLVPFAGAGVSLNWQDLKYGGNDLYLAASIESGGKFFLVDYAAIWTSLELLAATQEVYNKGDDVFDWRINLGTSWYF
jgi:hypothetical protein